MVIDKIKKLVDHLSSTEQKKIEPLSNEEQEELLQKADIAYGEYLAGECVTCHSADGADRGIPSIIGLDAEGFAYIMHSYRKKELDNKVMQLVAGRLDDEQIASLAVYFSSLPAK